MNREYSLYWDKSGLKWLSNIVVLEMSEGIADFVTAFCTRKDEDNIRKILTQSEHGSFLHSVGQGP